jgi:hypothetical protein
MEWVTWAEAYFLIGATFITASMLDKNVQIRLAAVGPLRFVIAVFWFLLFWPAFIVYGFWPRVR